jgi:hypothetical protein
MLVPGRDLLPLLMKWVVGLLVPVVVFTLWAGESIINAVIAPGAVTANVPTDPPSLIQAAVFTIVFYAAMIALAGYLVAADSGRRGLAELWIDILIFALIPLVLVIILTDVFTFSYSLIIGLALCALIWPVYLYVCGLIRKARNSVSTTPLKSLTVVNDEPRVTLMERAIAGSFWFSTAFAIVSLIVDLIFYFTDSLPALLLIWVFVRTLLLPVAGYFLGRLAGAVASRHTLSAKVNGNVGNKRTSIKRLFRNPMSREHQLKELSPSRAREEEKDLVPNDLPLHSTGAQRFYLTLLVAFVLFYPVLDPFLFGSGTDGRLASYGDAGFYIILALGLNVVVGFAGLLDLGYVAFFAIVAWGCAHRRFLGSSAWRTYASFTRRLPGNCDSRLWRDCSRHLFGAG